MNISQELYEFIRKLSFFDLDLSLQNYNLSIERDARLMKCDQFAVAKVAVEIANFGLLVDNGEGNIIYYNGKPQLQIGYRGIIKLALRSGEYSDLGSTVVRDGDSKNELMDKIKVKSNYVYTKENTSNYDAPIIGYYAFFELKNGFVKDLFMNIEELEAHASKYSSSWNKENKNFGHIEKDRVFEITVIKQLLGKYGPKSVEMKKFDNTDLKIFNKEEGQWLDNNWRKEEDLKVNKAPQDRVKKIIDFIKNNDAITNKQEFMKLTWEKTFNVQKTMSELTNDDLNAWVKNIKEMVPVEVK